MSPPPHFSAKVLQRGNLYHCPYTPTSQFVPWLRFIHLVNFHWRTSRSMDAVVHTYRRGQCRCMLSVYKSGTWAYTLNISHKFGVIAPPPPPPDLDQMYCTRGWVHTANFTVHVQVIYLNSATIDHMRNTFSLPGWDGIFPRMQVQISLSEHQISLLACTVSLLDPQSAPPCWLVFALVSLDRPFDPCTNQTPTQTS